MERPVGRSGAHRHEGRAVSVKLLERQRVAVRLRNLRNSLAANVVDNWTPRIPRLQRHRVLTAGLPGSRRLAWESDTKCSVSILIISNHLRAKIKAQSHSDAIKPILPPNRIYEAANGFLFLSLPSPSSVEDL